MCYRWIDVCTPLTQKAKRNKSNSNNGKSFVYYIIVLTYIYKIQNQCIKCFNSYTSFPIRHCNTIPVLFTLNRPMLTALYIFHSLQCSFVWLSHFPDSIFRTAVRALLRTRGSLPNPELNKGDNPSVCWTSNVVHDGREFADYRCRRMQRS